MKELIVHATEPSEAEVQAVLARAFPAADTYQVQAPDGSVREFRIDGPLGLAAPAELRPVWERLTTAGTGRYFIKAVPPRGGKPFDVWFYERLMEQARRHHSSFREAARGLVQDYVRQAAGALHSPAELARFEQLLFDLRTALRWQLAAPLPPDVLERARALGLSEADIFDLSGIAYRMGMLDTQLRRTGWSWTEALAAAARVPLTEADLATITWARVRAGQYLTPVQLRGVQEFHAAALQREVELLREMSADAVRREMHPLTFARELYRKLQVEDGIVRDWERVARTEIQEARLRGSWEGDRQARGWTADTLVYRNLSHTPCNGCLALYKTGGGLPRLYKVGEVEVADQRGPNRGPWREWHARIGPTHPQCVLAETRVGGIGISATSERVYDGEVVVLRTARGEQLTCTPNHPVLTATGWVPAGLLDVGRHVVRSRTRDGVLSRGLHDQDVPTSAEEIAETFRRAGQVASCPVPVAPEDFHGDGVGSEVAVVRTNRVLEDHRDATLCQQCSELFFVRRGKIAAPSSSLRAPAQFFVGPLAATNRLMRSLGHRGSSLRRQASEALLLCLLQGTRLYSMGLQAEHDGARHRTVLPGKRLGGFTSEVATNYLRVRQMAGALAVALLSADRGETKAAHQSHDHAVGDAVGARDRARGVPGDVALSHLLDGAGGELTTEPLVLVQRHRFRGPVFNFSTPRRFYLAEGFVVHNCMDSPWQTWLPALQATFERNAPRWSAEYARRGLE